MLGEVYLSGPEFEAFVGQAEPDLEMEQFIVSLEGVIQDNKTGSAIGTSAPSCSRAESLSGAAVGRCGASTAGAGAASVGVGRKRKLVRRFKPPGRIGPLVSSKPPLGGPEGVAQQHQGRVGYSGSGERCQRGGGVGLGGGEVALPPRAINNGFGEVAPLWDNCEDHDAEEADRVWVAGPAASLTARADKENHGGRGWQGLAPREESNVDRVFLCPPGEDSPMRGVGSGEQDAFQGLEAPDHVPAIVNGPHQGGRGGPRDPAGGGSRTGTWCGLDSVGGHQRNMPMSNAGSFSASAWRPGAGGGRGGARESMGAQGGAPESGLGLRDGKVRAGARSTADILCLFGEPPSPDISPNHVEVGVAGGSSDSGAELRLGLKFSGRTPQAELDEGSQAQCPWGGDGNGELGEDGNRGLGAGGSRGQDGRGDEPLLGQGAPPSNGQGSKDRGWLLGPVGEQQGAKDGQQPGHKQMGGQARADEPIVGNLAASGGGGGPGGACAPGPPFDAQPATGPRDGISGALGRHGGSEGRELLAPGRKGMAVATRVREAAAAAARRQLGGRGEEVDSKPAGGRDGSEEARVRYTSTARATEEAWPRAPGVHWVCSVCGVLCPSCLPTCRICGTQRPHGDSPVPPPLGTETLNLRSDDIGRGGAGHLQGAGSGDGDQVAGAGAGSDSNGGQGSKSGHTHGDGEARDAGKLGQTAHAQPASKDEGGLTVLIPAGGGTPVPALGVPAPILGSHDHETSGAAGPGPLQAATAGEGRASSTRLPSARSFSGLRVEFGSSSSEEEEVEEGQDS
ncbi:unnamed protein product [Discosporangium mesarthrocarpum]